MSSPRSRSSLVCAALTAWLALGCSGGESPAPPALRAPIYGGAPAPDDSAVVAVVNFAGGQCSGSLLTPRLVLTARHCVADTEGEDLEVLCGETPFEAPDSPGAIFVVLRPEVTDDLDDYLAVSEIRMPAGVGDDLCGTDEALLVLKHAVGDVTPLVPRLTAPVEPGEAYSAVGYGQDEAAQGKPSGVRKRLDGRAVNCLGADCKLSDVRENEWIGDGGPCHGDSGGPALDANGQVIGVVSRGKGGCDEPVFGDVFTRADWLKSEAKAAASDAREERPSWTCDEADPCPMELPEPEEPAAADERLKSSCVFSQHSGTSYDAWPLLALAMLRVRAWRSAKRSLRTRPPASLPLRTR